MEAPNLFTYHYELSPKAGTPTKQASSLWSCFFWSSDTKQSEATLVGRAHSLRDLPLTLGMMDKSPSQATSEIDYWKRVSACPSVEIELSGEYQDVINTSTNDELGIPIQLKTDYHRQLFVFKPHQGDPVSLRATQETNFQTEIVERFHEFCPNSSYEMMHLASQQGIANAAQVAHSHFSCPQLQLSVVDGGEVLTAKLTQRPSGSKLSLNKKCHIIKVDDNSDSTSVAAVQIKSTYRSWDASCQIRVEYLDRLDS